MLDLNPSFLNGFESIIWGNKNKTLKPLIKYNQDQNPPQTQLGLKP